MSNIDQNDEVEYAQRRNFSLLQTEYEEVIQILDVKSDRTGIDFIECPIEYKGLDSIRNTLLKDIPKEREGKLVLEDEKPYVLIDHSKKAAILGFGNGESYEDRFRILNPNTYLYQIEYIEEMFKTIAKERQQKIYFERDISWFIDFSYSIAHPNGLIEVIGQSNDQSNDFTKEL